MINSRYKKDTAGGPSIQTIVINNYSNNPNINDLRLDQDPQHLLNMLQYQEDLYPIVERIIKKCIYRPNYSERCLFITDNARNRVLYRENDEWKLDKGFTEGVRKICSHVYNEIEPMLEGLRKKVEAGDPDEDEILAINNKLWELESCIRNPDETFNSSSKARIRSIIS